VPRGFKENVVTGTLAAERAIDLLLKKMRGEVVASEISKEGTNTSTASLRRASKLFGKKDKRNQNLSRHHDAARASSDGG
jgi:hypothetical protein